MTLVEKGFVKLENFKTNRCKGQYAHLMTPKGLQEKLILTESFIERERLEFKDLKAEFDAPEQAAGLANELK